MLIVAAVYRQAPSFGFVNFDDDNYVYNNPRVLAGPTIDSLRWAFTSFEHSNWHPLTWASLMLDARLGQGKPFAFHLTNVILHAANTLALFLLLNSLTGRIWRSALVAALFAVHPLHVESVAWVTERKDVLSTLFWLLTTSAYAAYTRRHSGGWYALTLVLFALGLMSKPMLVSLPFTLLLIDYWPLGRTAHAGWKVLIIEKIPMFVMAAASAVVTYLAQSSTGATAAMEVWPVGVRMANAAVSLAVYVFKAVWPANLAAYYVHPRDTIPPWQVAGSSLALAAVTAATTAFRKRFPFLVTGWLWYLATLVPVIGLVQVGTQAMADRYTYIPLIGLFVMAVWAVPSARGSRSVKRAVAAASAAVVIVLALMANRQASTWRDSETLFTHAIRMSDANYVAHHNLAWHFLNLNPPQLDLAIHHCLKALQAYPEYPNAHNTLGMAYARKNDYRRAMQQFITARNLAPDWAQPHNNIGTTLLMMGRFKEALPEIDSAIELNPGLTGARCARALALNGLGRRGQAIAENEELLKTHPNDSLLRQTMDLLKSEQVGN